ncbi:MAG: T9SS type A sorting domain-containing protein [Bacteroidetes bacterium]|nr:T9SS type A sorting domain-containing protein [Bacteroidota bacterium]
MKKTLFITILAATVSLSLYSQIPNPGFENWTSMGTYNNPDGWDQLNAMTTSTGVYTCTKGTPGNPGTSYIKLVSKTAGAMGVMPGVAVSGVIDMMNMKPKSGFAFNQMPVSLTGNWQYMASGADQGFVAVYLTKWNSAMMMRDTIAKAMHPLTGMAMSWTTFTINLTYKSTAMPDSGIIVLSASGSTPVANSYLYVDNLAFSGTVMGVQNAAKSQTEIAVYPNPASNKFTVLLKESAAPVTGMQLIDVRGVLVKEFQLSEIQTKQEIEINTTDLPKGTYFLKVFSEQALPVVQKVIIQ